MKVANDMSEHHHPALPELRTLHASVPIRQPLTTAHMQINPINSLKASQLSSSPTNMLLFSKTNVVLFSTSKRRQRRRFPRANAPRAGSAESAVGRASLGRPRRPWRPRASRWVCGWCRAGEWFCYASVRERGWLVVYGLWLMAYGLWLLVGLWMVYGWFMVGLWLVQG